MLNFGLILKQNIKLAGLTNIEFAKKVDMSANYISMIITGSRLPKLENFNKMLEILQPRIPTDDLLDLSRSYNIEKFGFNIEEKDFNKEEKEWLSLIHKLSPHQKFLLKGLIEEIKTLNVENK